jgi:hypothetical protein
MRKILTWAAIVLLLVVSLQDPVVSRSTPYTADDFGPMPDHPWGGDQNNGRGDSERVTAVTGVPAIDITYITIYRWFFSQPAKNRQVFVIPVRPNNPPNNQPKPQTNGNTSNPNLTD